MSVFQCAICAKEVIVARREDAPWRPFCSERCKMVDLGRWLDGTYNIAEPLHSEDQQNPLMDAEPDED